VISWVFGKLIGFSAGFTNPFALKVIFLGVFIVGIFIGGWVVKGDFDNATIINLKAEQEKQLSDIRAQEEADRKAVNDAVAAKIAASEAAGRVQVSILTEQLQKKRKAAQNIQMEISHEEKINPNPVLPNNELTNDWVRIYNEALRGDGISYEPTSRINDESGRTNISVSSGLSQWDALRVHTINAESFSACRAQLNALIDFINLQAKTSSVVNEK